MFRGHIFFLSWTIWSWTFTFSSKVFSPIFLSHFLPFLAFSPFWKFFSFFFRCLEILENKQNKRQTKSHFSFFRHFFSPFFFFVDSYCIFSFYHRSNEIKWKFLLSMFTLYCWCSMWNWWAFYFILIDFFTKFWIKIGGLEIGEQTNLTNFYNSLTSNGSLNWDLSIDLCGQTGIVCDSSIPKRVIQLYSFFLFFSFLFFFFDIFLKKYNLNKIKIEIWVIKEFKVHSQPNLSVSPIYKICKYLSILLNQNSNK